VYLLAAAATTTTTITNVQSKNPILPAVNEIVWGLVSFVVLFVIMQKFAFPAVQKSMQARTERIRSNLDEAERVKGEAQSILDDYQRQLADARNESNRIIEEARQTADQLRQDLMARAEADAAELRQRTQDDLRLAQERALADLRAKVAEIAILAAEKVIERNLDRDTQTALVESFINQVESTHS
jgi:F-type H+-transporting ATPase subunit b